MHEIAIVFKNPFDEVIFEKKCVMTVILDLLYILIYELPMYENFIIIPYYKTHKYIMHIYLFADIEFHSFYS